MRSYTATTIAVLLAMLLVPLVPGDCAAASSMGAKIGLTYAKQSFSYSESSLKFDNSFRSGLGAGIFIEQPLVPYLSVRAEGMFIQKGFKVKVLQTDYNGQPIPQTTDLLYRINYLSMDLVGKASILSGTYVMAGPRFDIKLSTDQGTVTLLPSELEDKFKSTIFGWTLGVGQSFSLTPRVGVFVEGQLYLDQGKLYDKSDSGLTGTLETIRNKAFALFAGIRF